MASNFRAAFDPVWLSLREPVDHRSRPAALLPFLESACRIHQWSKVMDLGSGTGSNLRYLGSKLPGSHDWTLVDHDADLLKHPSSVEAAERVRSVHWVQGDLVDQGLTVVAQAHLVTGSALLDLVSREWLERLVKACRSAGCAAHFALTYDGEIRWFAGVGDGSNGDPDVDPDDEPLTRINGGTKALDRPWDRRLVWSPKRSSKQLGTGPGSYPARGGCTRKIAGLLKCWSTTGKKPL